MPEAAVRRRAVDDEDLAPAPHRDDRLRVFSYREYNLGARARERRSVPCSSSATSARTIDRPVPSRAPSAPSPSSAIASTTSPFRCASSISMRPAPCSSAFWSSSLKTSASAVARLPASETCSRRASTSRPPPIPCTSIARSRSMSSASSTSSSRCSVSASCTAAIARIRLTECSSASRGSTSRRVRLQAQQRRDRLEVVLHAVVDLLREHAAHDRAPVLERDGGVVRDRLEQRALLVGERDVLVRDELADLAALPPQRRAHGVRARAPLRPRDAAVLEHERRARRVDGVHRRLDDRLERLLEVERLRDRLGDLRERLELGDLALRLGVEPRVDDRLRHLARDRLEQLDLVGAVLARRARADVERARELLAAARSARRGSTRTPILGQVRELLPARVEMRLGGDRDRAPLGGGGARDALADAQARAARHLVERRAARRAEDELARAPRRRGRRSRRPRRARLRPCRRRDAAPPRGRASS